MKSINVRSGGNFGRCVIVICSNAIAFFVQDDLEKVWTSTIMPLNKI